jgi:hypothetical protein
MLSEGAIILGSTIVAALLMSGIWGEMTFSNHARLPSVFSLDMDRAKRSPRSLVLWSAPVVCIGTFAFAGWILIDLPRVEDAIALIDAWVAGTGLAMVAMQGFTLWRLNTWALR